MSIQVDESAGSAHRDHEDAVLEDSATARDVTELLRTDKPALGVSHYVRSLIETSSQPLVTVSPTGLISGVNEATVTLTGRSRESLIGAVFSDYFAQPTNDRDPCGSHAGIDRRPLGPDLPPPGADLRRGRAGSRDSGPRPRDSNAELEQFAYIASHDLAEPLRVISGPISLLARRYEGQLDEKADEFIRIAVDGCQRMQAIINALLAVSGLGGLDGTLDAVDCNQIVDSAVAALAVAIDESGAEVSVGALPTLRAEATQLSLVFQNLLSNALKFVRPGVRPRVVVAAERAGDGWCFSVIDNGIGVDPAHRERIFGMFKRLHGRDDYAGTGIGLALVKKIVEQHGGVIGVDAGSRGGSRFWFTLPQYESCAA